jgi:hypothetical protein
MKPKALMPIIILILVWLVGWIKLYSNARLMPDQVFMICFLRMKDLLFSSSTR